MKSLEQFLDELNRNGWSPVSYKHHPHHIKTAIKISRLRPAAKQCFANSQKCVALQEVIELKYAEGIVLTDIGYPLVHAWVVDADGVDHDLTLNPIPKILCKKIYDKHQVRKKMIETGRYDKMDMEWCNYMNIAVQMNIPLDLPYEKIMELVNSTRHAEDES